MPPSARPRRSRFGLLLLAAAALVVALGIYRGIHGRLAAEAALTRATAAAAVPSVSVVHPEAGAPDQEISLPGNVRAFMDTPIYARASGYLKRWYFDIGAHVKRGDLLAEIETPELDEQLRQARADLATAQANSTVAEGTWKRNETLYKGNWVSGQVRDTSEGASIAARSVVASKGADVKRLERMQSYEQVFAPFDGVITARNIDVGALIDASNAGRELFHLSATEKVRVFTAVPEAYTRAVHDGAPARVTLDEYPGVSFAGTIVRSAGAIDPASRTLTVEVDVDNRDGRLLPGAYAFVHLMLAGGSHAASVTVPAETVIFRKEGLCVALVKDGRAHLVPVKVGRDYGTRLEIVSGLAPADAVILDPSDSLVEGAPVRVPPPAGKADAAK